MSLFHVTPQLALCPGFQLELWESEEAGFVPETKHNCAFFVGKGRDINLLVPYLELFYHVKSQCKCLIQAHQLSASILETSSPLH